MLKSNGMFAQYLNKDVKRLILGLIRINSSQSCLTLFGSFGQKVCCISTDKNINYLFKKSLSRC